MKPQKYKFGDIVLLKFPFTDGVNYKKRPALVIKDTDDSDIILVRVTSQNKESKFDVWIEHWEQAGLKLPSIIRIHKIAALDRDLIEAKIGALVEVDMKMAYEKLGELFNLSSLEIYS